MASGCGDRPKNACLEQSDCDRGFTCVLPTSGADGTCQACPAEVPYDGLDNDCNPLTLDRDLDGDNDNSTDALNMPGGDCDDRDPRVSSKKPEVCGDGKDNNCDLIIDGPGCGAITMPTIRFTSPNEGGIYGGGLDVNLTVEDLSGVANVAIKIDGNTRTTLTAAPYKATIDTRLFPDGQHLLTIVALSESGGESSLLRNVAFDNTAPTLNIDPPTGSMVNGVVDFEITASDANGLASLTNGTVTSSASPIIVTRDFETMPTGSVDITATATDRAIVDGMPTGNSVTLVATVNATNFGPSVTLRSPLAGQSYGGMVNIDADVVDPLGVTAVAVTLDGNNILTAARGPIMIMVDTRVLNDGPHPLVITTRDTLMNERVTNAVLNVDNTGPTFAFTPSSGTVVSGQVILEVAALDPAGISSVTSGASTSSTSPLLVSLDFDPTPDGTYRFTASARDRAIIDNVAGMGNAATGTISLIVDNPGPMVTFIAPILGESYGGFVDIEADVSDFNNVDQVVLRREGILLATLTQPPWRVRLDTRLLTEGPHAIEAVSRDSQGNISTSTQTLIIDNIGPIITFSEPVAASQVSQTVTVTANAADPAGVRLMTSAQATSNTATLTYALDTLLIRNGPLDIAVIAYDDAIVDNLRGVGNARTTRLPVIVFNPENEAPIVRILSPGNDDGVYRTVEVVVDATSGVGIDHVDFGVDGRVVATVATPPYTATVFVGATTASLTLTATAVGNNMIATSTSVFVNVVQAPPLRVVRVLPAPTLGGGGYAVGDATGDGINDIVTGGGGGALFHRGIGGGEFFPGVLLGETPNEVVFSDFTGDGQLDIIGVSGDNLYSYRNIGGGRFAAPVRVPLGPVQATDLAADDLDGDGDVDVIVGRSAAGGDFVIVHQTSPGTFSVIASRGGVGSVTEVVLSDVDNDGTPDIVLGRTGGGNNVVTVYRNADASGTFGGAGIDTQFGGPPESIALGDLNGDAYPDLVANIPNPAPLPSPLIALSGFIVRMGNPLTPGRWAPANTPAFPDLGISGPSGATIADVDGDGDNDVTVTAHPNGGLRLFLNDGRGNLSYGRRLVMGRTPSHPTVVDLDGDGDVEILATAGQDSGVAIADGEGAGTFVAATSIDVIRPPNTLAFGQLAGSALGDFAVGFNPYTDIYGVSYIATLQVLRNDGNDRYTVVAQNLIPNIQTVTNMAIGNLDGQNGLDITMASDNAGGAVTQPCAMMPPLCADTDFCDATNTCQPISATIMLANAGSGYTMVPLSINRPRGTAIGDVRAGGNAEAIFTFDNSPANGGSVVLDSRGTTLYSSTTQQGATSVMVADLADPPGLLDYVVANQTTNNVTLYRQRAGGFDPPETYNAFASVSAFAQGFLGGDSRVDLLAVSLTGVVAMLGHPNFTLVAPTSWPAGSTPTRIASGDLNGDGLSDVAVLNVGENRLAVLIARPQGGFFAPDFVSLPTQPSDVAMADVDGDNVRDLVVTTQHPYASSLSFIHNR